jgi:hypothetical protein
VYCKVTSSEAITRYVLISNNYNSSSNSSNSSDNKRVRLEVVDEVNVTLLQRGAVDSVLHSTPRYAFGNSRMRQVSTLICYIHSSTVAFISIIQSKEDVQDDLSYQCSQLYFIYCFQCSILQQITG